jgi:hypothetical protein
MLKICNLQNNWIKVLTNIPNDKDIRVKVLGLELGAGKGELVY